MQLRALLKSTAIVLHCRTMPFHQLWPCQTEDCIKEKSMVLIISVIAQHCCWTETNNNCTTQPHWLQLMCPTTNQQNIRSCFYIAVTMVTKPC